MYVSGFTFIKNALIYDYPVVEAIRSILPICDEVVVAVGRSDDDTLGLIRAIDPDKVRIVETEWDESLREGGRVLAIETDKALAAISPEADWAFYIQGDEVIHEQYLPAVKQAMTDLKNDKEVDGLLFDYLHFYGSYDYVGASKKWYGHEIRVVRPGRGVYSHGDAQGFRKGEGDKLKVKQIDACMYHYGWVKEPSAMQKKQENFNKYWHDDKWMEENIAIAEEFDYMADISELKRFEGTHPQVMNERLSRLNWTFDYDISLDRRTLKDKVKTFFADKLGVDLGYRNYILIDRHRHKT